MSKYSKLFNLALFINLTIVAGSFAEDDLNDLSLEELLSINVTSASKKSERIQDAPGTITAYTSKEIETLGYYTLSDLANITPGFSSYTIYGEKVFETRGQKAGSFNNNKHLLLIDGIPINNARNYKAMTEEDLPLFFAQRVEFLKGPASSLYGTGAFYGVVNVISKELTENGSFMEAKGSFGSMDYNKRVMANSGFKNDLGEAKVNLGYYKKDASRAFVGTTNDPNNLFWDDQESKFLNMSYKLNSGIFSGLSAGLIYISKNGGLGEHWMEGAFSSELNDLTWQTFAPYMKYQKELSEKWRFNSYLKLNESSEKGWWAPFNSASFKEYKGTGSPFNAYDSRVSNIEGLAEAYYDINDRMNFIFGTNVDSRYQKGVPYSYSYQFSADAGDPFIREKSSIDDSGVFNTYSAYSQFSYRAPVLKDLLITLGARYDIGQSLGKKDIQVYQQLSPRIGLVQKLTDNFNVKLLWGNALRAPGLKEAGLNSESKAASADAASKIKDLKAETISTIEAGVTFNNDNFSSQLTYFNNRTFDALDGSKLGDLNIFVNSNGVTYASGVELETQYALNKSFRVFGNYALASSIDPSGKVPNDIPIHKANFGLNYTLEAPFILSSSLVARLVSDYTVSDPKLPRPAGNFVMDLNFVLPIPTMDNITAELQIRNILDQKYKLPKNGIPDVPGTIGRTFLFTMGYKL